MLTTDDQTIYIGDDLEDMSSAVNYYDWILEKFRPYVGKRIVEVGAGSGTVSKKLIEKFNPESFVGIEPSPEVHARLAQNLKDYSNTKTIGNFLPKVKDQLDRPDTFFYINVMEHVERDQEEVQTVFDTLPSGGHMLVFVPALQAIYGEFDRKVGHYRRYHKGQLKKLFDNVGFEIRELHYVDMLGIIPWFILFKVLKKEDLGGNAGLYDKLAMPIISRLENIVHPPIGKNLFLVARKK